MSLLSKRKWWKTSLTEDNRRIELSLGSNYKGYYIKILERRREGKRFLIIPFDSNKDGPKLFIRALSSFIHRAFVSKPTVDGKVQISSNSLTELKEPQALFETALLVNGTPTLPNSKENEDLDFHAPLIEGRDAEGQLVLYKGETKNCNTFNDLFPPLSKSFLSPFASSFVPLSYNKFAVLHKDMDRESLRLEDEDPFSKLNDQSLVLYLNAVEDHTKEREGPILYTHSEGEDLVFIDSMLKPLQIDLSRFPKHPLYLHKELKGRKTYSPSQIVTRSKAKLLAQGRRITPIGWEEEQDLADPLSHEDEVISFFKLCCPNKKEDPIPPKKPMTKTAVLVVFLYSLLHLDWRDFSNENWEISRYDGDFSVKVSWDSNRFGHFARLVSKTGSSPNQIIIPAGFYLEGLKLFSKGLSKLLRNSNGLSNHLPQLLPIDFQEGLGLVKVCNDEGWRCYHGVQSAAICDEERNNYESRLVVDLTMEKEMECLQRPKPLAKPSRKTAKPNFVKAHLTEPGQMTNKERLGSTAHSAPAGLVILGATTAGPPSRGFRRQVRRSASATSSGRPDLGEGAGLVRIKGPTIRLLPCL
ncbi:unnamed protein product [Cuscuta campestris]|uniref:Uncharacterized protein n=1 Tax=Cuscuta campestris TaxID=132261 RepID=A0A484LY23_9ASTE|nr:unnamed protein product [Cuscuta campestris]